MIEGERKDDFFFPQVSSAPGLLCTKDFLGCFSV